MVNARTMAHDYITAAITISKRSYRKSSLAVPLLYDYSTYYIVFVNRTEKVEEQHTMILLDFNYSHQDFLLNFCVRKRSPSAVDKRKPSIDGQTMSGSVDQKQLVTNLEVPISISGQHHKITVRFQPRITSLGNPSQRWLRYLPCMALGLRIYRHPTLPNS